MAGASRSIVINAPREKVFDAITAYETYPQFLTECKEVKVSGRVGNEVNVHYRIELVKSIRYTLRMKEERPSKVSWSFVEGEMMKDNTGTWTLETNSEGKTLATYTIEMVLGGFVPKAIVNGLVDASLPKMLEAFKNRVEKGSA